MGLPAGRVDTPMFQSTPTEGATMEFGGNPMNPNAAPKQPTPFQGIPLMPEALPNFTSQEAEALRNQFTKAQDQMPWQRWMTGGRIF